MMHPFLRPDPQLPTSYDMDRTPTLKVLPGDGLSKPVANTDSDRGFALSSRLRRDLVLIHPDDWFCVDWLVSHQQLAGLDPGRGMLKPESYSELDFEGRLSRHRLAPFIWNEAANLAQPDEDWLRITRLANTKNWLLAKAETLGLRVPDTIYCQGKNELELMEAEMLLGYPLFLKISSEFSFTGNGVFAIDSETELLAHLALLSDDIPFQLQEDLRKKNVVAFPNLQYYEAGGKAKRLLLTSQVLEGNEHCGNGHDPDFAELHSKAWKTTEKLANMLALNGLKWIFAFDLAICLEDGRYTYYLIECNGRPNGSTFATAVAAKLPGYDYRRPWTAKTVPISRRLDQIDLGPLLYREDRQYGIVPHIASIAKNGKLGVCFIGTPAQQQRLENQLMPLVC